MQRRLLDIKNRVKNAAERSGRREEDIVLIGVTKTVDIDIINEAIKLGLDNIGENKVQEFLAKYDKIKDNVKIHMIGHLQTNKVKYIIDKVDLIHSLDRLSLAKELQKRAENEDITVNTLIQVNVAEEESKFGLKVEEVMPFIENIVDYNRVNIKGLMTIAPYSENPEDVRYVFKEMKKLFNKLREIDYPNVKMEYLSMGMTNDFEVAIEEGANMVRIGTAIFGERIY